MTSSTPALEPLWRRSRLPAFGGIGWESLLSQARRARLHARLAQHLSDVDGMVQVPPAARVHLKNAMKEAGRKRDEVFWETDRIAHALANVPTPVVLLKGAAYVLAGLPPGRGRLFSDVDILVPREHLREVEDALFAAGWIAQKLDPYDERYYRDWMHELPPLEHVSRHTQLDVHHTITPPTSRFAIDAGQLLARARPLPGHPRLAVLSPADMVLHGIVHLLQDGDFSGGLRDLLDFDDLLRHFSADPSFWPELLKRTSELGLEAVLYYALTEARRLFGTAVPPELEDQLTALQPPALRRHAMLWLLGLALRPDHPDCDSAFTGLARSMLYVRSHWLRMPWHQILPHLARKAWRRASSRRQGDDAKVRPQARIGM